MKSWSAIVLSAAACGAVIACATTPGAPTRADRVIVSSDAGEVRSYEDIPRSVVSVDAAPAAVLTALRAVYSELGVEDKLAGTRTNRVGNTYFSKHGRLAGAPLSQFIDCGSTMTGPAADNYPVNLSLVSSVAPDSAGSRVETLLSAVTVGSSGGSGQIACRSRGMLERRLQKMLTLKLVGL